MMENNLYTFYNEYRGKTFYSGTYILTIYKPASSNGLAKNNIKTLSRNKIILNITFKIKFYNSFRNKTFSFVAFLYDNTTNKIIKRIISGLKFKSYTEELKEISKGFHNDPKSFIKYFKNKYLNNYWIVAKPDEVDFLLPN